MCVQACTCVAYVRLFTYVFFIKYPFCWEGNSFYILLSSSIKRLSVLEQCFSNWWRAVILFFRFFKHTVHHRLVGDRADPDKYALPLCVTHLHTFHNTQRGVCSVPWGEPMDRAFDGTAVSGCSESSLMHPASIFVKNHNLHSTVLEYLSFEKHKCQIKWPWGCVGRGN